MVNGRCSAGVCTSRDAQCEAVAGNLGITKACHTPFGGCRMICQGKNGQCIEFKATFSNGIACGTNGYCKDGVCSESVLVTAFTQYWLAVIVVCAMFLAALLACILASCRTSYT